MMATASPYQLTLFPLPPLAPVRPAVGTLADAALRMLLAGHTLTHPAFESRTGSWRLAAIVFELRAMGWPVAADHVPSPTDEAPTRCIAQYSLPAHLLAAVEG